LAHNQRMCFNRSFSDSSEPIPHTNCFAIPYQQDMGMCQHMGPIWRTTL
jgi:hypothetical protein